MLNNCTKSIVGLLASALVLTALSPHAHAASAQEIRNKYQAAKKLQADGKYEEAITAFKEVKVLRYHPILDYRIGQCYEALNQLKLAITSYKLYLKFYDRFTPGKNHPKKPVVRQKIEQLEARSTAPPVTLPPDTAPPSDPPEGKTAGQQGHQPGHYYPDQPGGGRHPPGHPDQPPGVHKKPSFPKWKAFYLGADFGAAGFSGGDLGDASSYGLGLSAWIFYRPLRYISAGVVGIYDTMTVDSSGSIYSGRPTLGSVQLEVRGHLPFYAHGSNTTGLELWAGASAGYAGLSLEVDGLSDTYRADGGIVGASVGAELSLYGWMSVGAIARLAKPFLETSSDHTGETVQAEWTLDEGPDEGVVWYIGFSTTFHLFIN
jgi:hypothetical protein